MRLFAWQTYRSKWYPPPHGNCRHDCVVYCLCFQAVMEQREARKAAAAEGADGRTVSRKPLYIRAVQPYAGDGAAQMPPAAPSFSVLMSSFCVGVTSCAYFCTGSPQVLVKPNSIVGAGILLNITLWTVYTYVCTGYAQGQVHAYAGCWARPCNT